MSNTPNHDPYSNQDPAQNYGNTPQPPYTAPPQELQGPYGPPPNYYPPPPYPPQGPQGPYGYGANPEYDLNMPPGPSGYGYNNLNVAPASTPLPLGAAMRQLPSQYIRVLTKPGAATFAAEQGKAAWNIVWVQLAFITVLTVLFGFAFVNLTLATTLNAQHLPASTIGTLRGTFSALPLSYIILTPIGFFIGVGIYHLIAKAFGGTGTFLAYTYSYLLFYVPIAIVSLLLALIPFIGGVIAGLLGIYSIVLQVFMTMAVHRLRGGRATLAVLILPIIGFVLAIILGIILIAVVVSALQHVR
ncbi:MAG: hypothetical protein NVS4B11_27580 [Ktedonobacteraceae bacterium]